tara:strand:+ start:14048 stop:14449 length:402 start_codon:yes stop_codon:yes gene_type:complete
MIKKNKLQIKKSPHGNITKVINKSSKYYKGFGELYFSQIKKNKIKGWKKHTKMTMNIKVIMGKVKFILSKDMKSFKKIIISENDKFLLTISKNIFFAFQGLDKKNEILNFSNIKHSKKECINLPLNRINYKWN